MKRSRGRAIAALLRRRPPPVDEPAEPDDLTPDELELAELATRLDAVAVEHARERDRLLRSRLQPVVTRRVPVRVIEPLSDRGATRVRFADGTAVTVRGDVAGDAGVLAAAVRGHGVVVGSCTTDADGTHVVFDWSGGRHHVSMRVTGLDQPD